MPVAREELPDAQGGRRVHRTNQHDVADALRHQLEPAIDERPHQDLADLSIRLHEREQLVTGQLDHLPGFGHTRPRQRAPADDASSLRQ